MNPDQMKEIAAFANAAESKIYQFIRLIDPYQSEGDALVYDKLREVQQILDELSKMHN